MESFEVSKKLLSLGATYEVRPTGSEGLVAVIKGALTSRKMTLHEGTADGPEIASISPNLFGTKWEIVDTKKTVLATITFPAIAIKKSFTIGLDGKEYKADGGFLALGFKCNDLENQSLLDVAWEPTWTDKFVVQFAAPLTRDLACLAMAAIHQKYYTS
jgi:uncharacterized protein YxjI